MTATLKLNVAPMVGNAILNSPSLGFSIIVENPVVFLLPALVLRWGSAVARRGGESLSTIGEDGLQLDNE